MTEAVLYTRKECCLCDAARSQLEAHGLTVREVDIDDHPLLQAKYTDCVPVVWIDGRERFRGRIDERLLGRILQMR